MYEKAEEALKQILGLVEKCPPAYQGTCFEVLLGGYVEAELTHQGVGKPNTRSNEKISPIEKPEAESQIPTTVAPRFKNTARRLGVQLASLEALFDFSVDPFSLHPLTIAGENNAEKTRNAALLAASRSYFSSGSWLADWQETKLLCIDQNCYDKDNHSAHLKKGTGSVFKNVEAGKSIELSSIGKQDAEKLLKSLAESVSL